MSDWFQNWQGYSGIRSANRCGWNSLSVWKGHSDFCFVSRKWKLFFFCLTCSDCGFQTTLIRFSKRIEVGLGVCPQSMWEGITLLIVCMRGQYVSLHIWSICARLYMYICVGIVCTHWANFWNDPKLVMLGTGPPIWGKYKPPFSLTLRLNKGKLRCPSRKSLYENRSCSAPHSGVCNHRLQGTNKMTFHTQVQLCPYYRWAAELLEIFFSLSLLCGTSHWLTSCYAERICLIFIQVTTIFEHQNVKLIKRNLSNVS